MAQVIEGAQAYQAAQQSGLANTGSISTPNLAPPNNRRPAPVQQQSRPVQQQSSQAPVQQSSQAPVQQSSQAPVQQSRPVQQAPAPPQPKPAPAPPPVQQPRGPTPLSKSGQKALIILFVVALIAGFIIWFVIQGQKMCSKNSTTSCNNSSESMQCNPSSPSFDNCCKCNGGDSSGKDQSSDGGQSSKSDNDAGKCHQS